MYFARTHENLRGTVYSDPGRDTSFTKIRRGMEKVPDLLRLYLVFSYGTSKRVPVR